jgi:hypothetical protein
MRKATPYYSQFRPLEITSEAMHQMDYWHMERGRYLAAYQSCSEDCENVFHAAIIQCEATIAALHCMHNLQSLIPKLCDGK